MNDIAQRTQEAFELYNHGKGYDNYLQILDLISQGVDVQAISAQ